MPINQPELDISLLGGVTITHNGTAVSGFASRKVEALLAYLVCDPRPHPRETLATLLWPENDQSRALANLSVALSSLRKQLEPFLLTDRHTIGFKAETDYRLDTAVFEQAITQARERQQGRGKLSRSGAAQLATAVSLYKGDFLAGFNVRGAPEFEAWTLLEQERLRQLLLAALADLVTFHRQRNQPGDGIRYAQQLLAVDPLQEAAHRQLMTLYAQDDRRPAALAQYEQCAAILADELGVEPDVETTTLYEQIKDNQVDLVTLSPGHLVTQSRKHNLPAAATSFIGREAELARIEAWLADPSGRLLTIVGPGGIGKSRLAQEATRAHLGQFADGVWYISLVPHTDTAEVVTAVAETISFTLSGQEEPATQLLDHLQDQEMLLLLDNMEHLLTPSLLDFITQLTEQAPELRLIVTSRERLRLQAETLLELRGLPYPVVGEQYSVSSERYSASSEPITDYAAIQLFVNRVQRVRADFRLEEEATAVTQLCQLVGGLPLALELAAAWTRVLSVTEIVAEIQRGLDALTATLHDLPARHRSLRAVIESSWRMLPPDEQTLFRKLAVFRGGLTRPAAEEIAGASLNQLMTLVDRSFLRRDADQRFRRHPLLLQFAQEQLAAQPEEQAQTKADHTHFFADLVQAQEPALQGADAQQALATIGADLENIRAAWQWALAQNDEDTLAKLVAGVGRFLADRSRYLEGSALFADSLEKMRTWPSTAVREQIAAKIQVELGFFLYQTGRFADAETTLKAANALTRQHNLIRARINCLKHLGDVTGDQGKREESRRYLEEALRLSGGHDAPAQKLTILNALGNLEVGVGAYGQAMAYFEEAMALAKSLGDTLRIAILHNNIAIIANRQEKFHEAIRQYQLAREGFKAHQHDWGMAATSHNIGMVYAELEQYDEALANINEAYAAHEKIGHRRGMVGGLSVMGTIYRELGKRRQARRHFYDSLLLAQEVGVVWSAISTLVDVAELEISYGELRLAAILLTFAVQHPAIEATTLANAQKLLEELRAEFPPEMMAEVETAVQSHTLDSLIDHLLRDYAPQDA